MRTWEAVGRWYEFSPWRALRFLGGYRSPKGLCALLAPLRQEICRAFPEAGRFRDEVCDSGGRCHSESPGAKGRPGWGTGLLRNGGRSPSACLRIFSGVYWDFSCGSGIVRSCPGLLGTSCSSFLENCLGLAHVTSWLRCPPAGPAEQ